MWKSCRTANGMDFSPCPNFEAEEGERVAAWMEELEARQGLPEQDTAAARVLAAAAALNLFLQANLTGPPPRVPIFPGDLARRDRPADEEVGLRREARSGPLGQDTVSPGDRWAMERLCINGEEPRGRCFLPQYLLMARILLLSPLGWSTVGEASQTGHVIVPQSQASPAGDHVGQNASKATSVGTEVARYGNGHASNGHTEGKGQEPGGLPDLAMCGDSATWLWWALRVVAVQQRVLRHWSASLKATVASLIPRVEEVVQRRAPPDLKRHLEAVLQLEVTAIWQAYGDTSAARASLEAASEVLGLRVSLSGAMGKRTVHQEAAKALLVVSIDEEAQQSKCGLSLDSGIEVQLLDAGMAGVDPDLAEVAADVDILPLPEIETKDGTREEAVLSGAEQALLLGHARQEKRGTAADELREWRVAPYLDGVLRQPRSFPLLRWAALLARAQHERQRNRTRGRSLLMLEQLATAFSDPDLPVPIRLRYGHAVHYPLLAGLRTEMAMEKVALGLIGEAMQEFEALELWDALITCYSMRQKDVQAEELIRRRLEVTPDDPRLWCALGTITKDDTAYEEAWKRSKGAECAGTALPGSVGPREGQL
eukprot:jgi/Botrbrau1/6199/Bobra.0344s0039.1